MSAELTATLVGRLRAGDEEAARVLDELYREPIVRFCWGYLRSGAEAEDATQEIFAKVLVSATVPDDFRVWLYRVARNHCLNAVRDRGRRREETEPLELARSATGDLTRMVRAEEREHVAHALAELPESYREVLRLRYAEDLSRTEIAAVLELPESLVKTRLYEGLKRLKERAAGIAGSGGG